MGHYCPGVRQTSEASCGEITAPQIADLAHVLRTLLGEDLRGPGEYRLEFHDRSGPSDYVALGISLVHSVIPRLTRVVGFEFGSRMLINTVLPERPRNSFET
jgi:hypothetical protein